MQLRSIINWSFLNFHQKEKEDTDFNDLFRKEGAEKALACLQDGWPRS